MFKPRFLFRPSAPFRLLPLAIAALCCALGSAHAQVIVRPFYYGGTWSGPLILPEPEVPARLPRALLFDEIRDQGFRPLGIIGRTRDTVTLEAIDRRDRRFRLIVDAFDGEILSHQPLTRFEPPRGPRFSPEADAPRQHRKAPDARSSTTPPPAAPRSQPAVPGAKKAAPSGEGPVAPARDPSQWGKAG